MVDEENNASVTFCDGHLSCVGADYETIPLHLLRPYTYETKNLDLSFNQLRSLAGLDLFLQLEELVLDNNLLPDDVTLPRLAKLHTLTLNKNCITQFDTLIDQLKGFPSLRYLSLLGNPACPDQLSSMDKDANDYRRYRYFVLFNLPKLKFLDSSAVRADELAEAKRVGVYLQSIPVIKDSEVNLGNSPGKEDYSPLPQQTSPAKHIGTYGTCKYIYYGRHSEGNRFIRNKDL